ncbi:MFS transporter [Caulobacter sp. NIBR1757]|uniref:spinster family MFS transporter n=1 Tax=Caulobacter sp. NIBR1757 TaxID=3016000 RepID=UPI0022EFDAE6|nr:MFS transporter [Caulobacter sp. NIBR1757]WGM39100.1 Multidrug resistance protein MdtG [Caulobacter sp. NIBR1757]
MTDAAVPAPPESKLADRADDGPGIEPLSKGFRRYALWTLMIIYTLNFLDRQIVNILAEPIKKDLHLADWQLGMMTGLAFALFYTVLGIPIARKAEKSNRPMIIGGALAVWSGFTMLCGFAQNFWHLVLARIGVGVGEAGCTPPAHSLITDYVPREKRASAIAFYSIGTPLGSLIGMAMGGLIADAYGWRAAFLVAGAPGIFFALLTFFTLPEPRKKLTAIMAAKATASVPLREAMLVLFSKKTFWLIAFAAAIKAFIGYGHAPFTASFFFRSHAGHIADLSAWITSVTGFSIGPIGTVGVALSVVSGTAGVLGVWLGGVIADKLGARDLRAYVIVPAIASLITIPIYITAVSVPNATVALILLALPAIIGSLWYGPVYATAQSIVQPQMRATCAAVLLFIINLVGLGLGPLFVGILSDLWAGGILQQSGLTAADCGKAMLEANKAACGVAQAEGLRWALIVSMGFNVIAFALFWMARKTIREEMVS